LDNIYSEKQERLLANALYSSWPGFGEPSTFLALANVGLFYDINQPPVVPDFLLSLGVRARDDLSIKHHRSYLVSVYRKLPELLIEVVSNTEGQELGEKKDLCARIGIPIYVVWDPYKIISKTRLQVFGLNAGNYEAMSPAWFPQVGLGLAVWRGVFQGAEEDWLRWRDQQGNLILTGDEQAEQQRRNAEQQRQRAEEAELRAERLAAQLRQLGVRPPNGND